MQLINTSSNSRKRSIISTNRLPDNLICFSHLRWDFVFQRPQHLLTRLSKRMNVFYLEEPVIIDAVLPYYSLVSKTSRLTVITPHLPTGLTETASLEMQKQLFDDFVTKRLLTSYGFWYYTPMALQFSRTYEPEV